MHTYHYMKWRNQMIINYKELGQRIRDCRKKKGITQQRLADDLVYSVPYISYLETGRKCITLSTLVDIAEYLDTTADFLIYGESANTSTLALQQRLQYCNEEEKAIFFAITDAVLSVMEATHK